MPDFQKKTKMLAATPSRGGVDLWSSYRAGGCLRTAARCAAQTRPAAGSRSARFSGAAAGAVLRVERRGQAAGQNGGAHLISRERGGRWLETAALCPLNAS